MDWINIKNQQPVENQLIWGKANKGNPVLGRAYKLGEKWRIIYDGGNMSLTKWATYDVIY